MFTATASTVPQAEVDKFLKDVATERQIDLDFQLNTMTSGQPTKTASEVSKLSAEEEKQLEDKLSKLRG